MVYDTHAQGDAPEFYLESDQDIPAERPNRFEPLVKLSGAVVSIGLLAGVGLWSYQLMMRDVTGIPVVRAVEGEMRIRPQDPGGELAQHQGLSVNGVAAEGGAAKPADRLVLAPQPVQLTDEDLPMDEDAVAVVQQAIADQAVVTEAPEDAEAVAVDAAKIAEAAENGSVEDLVAALTEGVEPLRVVEEPEQVVRVAATQGDAETDALASVLGAPNGLGSSLRPKLRPSAGATPVRADVSEVDVASIPSGTRLVQLGAYDSAEIARKEWDQFAGQFTDLVAAKQRVVQKASSGGRTFYRLRAMGFEDLADARRFCSAVVAEGADCIPVVTR